MNSSALAERRTAEALRAQAYDVIDLAERSRRRAADRASEVEALCLNLDEDARHRYYLGQHLAFIQVAQLLMAKADALHPDTADDYDVEVHWKCGSRPEVLRVHGYDQVEDLSRRCRDNGAVIPAMPVIRRPPQVRLSLVK